MKKMKIMVYWIEFVIYRDIFTNTERIINQNWFFFEILKFLKNLIVSRRQLKWNWSWWVAYCAIKFFGIFSFSCYGVLMITPLPNAFLVTTVHICRYYRQTISFLQLVIIHEITESNYQSYLRNNKIRHFS